MVMSRRIRVSLGLSPRAGEPSQNSAATPSQTSPRCFIVKSSLADRENLIVSVRAAALVGIRFFATGGIGGVHRGHPEDVSADLEEIARSPVLRAAASSDLLNSGPENLGIQETVMIPDSAAERRHNSSHGREPVDRIAA